MKGLLQILNALLLFFTVAVSQAATVQFSDRATFLSTLSVSITDGYDAAGYQSGDLLDSFGDDVFSDSAMSAVLGETSYMTTGWEHLNTIWNQSLDSYYCAGCNGSVLMDFSTTSVGDSSGVFGVGVDLHVNEAYYAFVTFGDGSTQNYALPILGSVAPAVPGQFWGITSDLSIRSIHFGLQDGAADTGYIFSIDDLTIGAAVVPVPAAVWLFVSGLIGLLGIARRDR